MSWSFPIGAIRGTVLRVHLTFLLFLLWIGYANYQRGGEPAAVVGVTFILLLFVSVLLHELGHVFAARRYGVQTPDITLLPIGGVARLERLPEKPSEELVVALAGPLVNLVIAAVLLGLLHGVLPARVLALDAPGPGLLARLATANLFLAAFNLLPAFPMDGGRVLRALLATRMGTARATATAAGVGQAVAFGLGALGLFGNPMLLFIAVFVYLGAASETAAIQMRDAARGTLALDAAVTRFESLTPLSSVEDAVAGLIRTTQHEFPVVDGGGRLRGVLTRNAMIHALRATGPDTPVMEAMTRDIPTVAARAPLEAALKLLHDHHAPAIGVVDADGRLQGLITHENVGELMMIRAARSDRATPGERRGPR